MMRFFLGVICGVSLAVIVLSLTVIIAAGSS